MMKSNLVAPEKMDAEQLMEEDKFYNERQSDVVGLIKDMVDYNLAYVFPTKYEVVKNYLQFNGDLETSVKMIQEKSGSDVQLSASVYPLIQQTVDTFYSNAIENLPQTRAVAFEQGDEEAAKHAQDFHDWAQVISRAIDKRNGPIVKDCIMFGTGYGMFSLKSLRKGKLKMAPSLEHISFFNMFHEPLAKTFDDSRYKVRRRIVSTNQFYNSYNWFAKRAENIEKFKELPLMENIYQYGAERLYSRDFDRIWSINDYKQNYVDLCCAAQEGSENMGNVDGSYDISEQDLFQIDYEKNKLHEVYEVWSDEGLSIVMDGHLVYDDESPTEQPFGIITYDENPGSARGIGLGEKLLDQQRKATFFWNGIENGIKMHLYPDYFSDGTLKDGYGNDIQFHIRGGGQVLKRETQYTNSGSALQPITYVDYNFIDRARIQLNEIRLEAQQVSGLNSYVSGGSSKIERSAAGVQARTAAFRSRLKHMSMSLTAFDNHGFHIRLELSYKYIGKSIHARVIADGEPKYFDISLGDIRAKFDIITNDEGNRLATKAERLQNSINILNILDKYLFDQNGLPIIDIKDYLHKMLKDVDMLADVPIYDEEKLKEYIDMVSEIGKYQQIKAMEAQTELQQAQLEAQQAQQQEQQTEAQPAGQPGSSQQSPLFGQDQQMQELAMLQSQLAGIPREGLLPEEAIQAGII